MRVLVKRGFCVSPGVYAQVGQVIELADGWLLKDMLARESIEAAPAEEPPATAAAEDPPAPAEKSGKKGK